MKGEDQQPQQPEVQEVQHTHQAGPSAMSAPPSYEYATFAPNDPKSTTYPVDQKQQPQAIQPPSTTPYPIPVVPSTQAGAVTVYHYIHPVTQHRIDSLLPPDHPEMQCLQFGHVPKTRFGLAGILAAIFWFPLGVGCMLIDRDTQCSRCKKVLKGKYGQD
ncbi:hypothetical protein CPB86DRAFT_786355 [Serendipita vermifera]|nr:hypothetical protein CPB86DRAFT_786355 [Serendipita vermifera]